MTLRPYLIKGRQKLKQLARRARPTVTRKPLDRFFRNHWQGDLPDSGYFGSEQAGRFFFDTSRLPEYRSALSWHFAGNREGARARGELVLDHTFDLLGSGPTSLGSTINWHLDFKSGVEWPMVRFDRVPIVYADNSSDIKVPWELSRLHCLVDLGRAWHFTSDERYGQEWLRLVADWQEKNPVDRGVNWACSMEVAIRAVNLLWSFHLFADFPNLSTIDTRNAIQTLYHHALHIENNLEFVDDGANSNHLIADYLGLYVIGTLIPNFDRSTIWRAKGANGLENEISAQVLSDGADYECSTSYHRLVLEMFLSAYLLGRRNNFSFSAGYMQRLRKMVEFSAAMTGSSGLTPLIGDNDDGFVVKLSNDSPDDHRSLIDIGACQFALPVPAHLKMTEERLWYLGPESLNMRLMEVAPRSQWFRESGYVVIKDRATQFVLNAVSVPARQFGGHKHNDLLGITLEVKGRAILVDPGTSCYTSDADLRNRSRSTHLHNTLSIDHQEQNRFVAGRLFYLQSDGSPRVDFFNTAGQIAIISASHNCYARLDRIVHRRTVWVSLTEQAIAIRDEILSDLPTSHQATLQFLSPNRAILNDDGAVALNAGLDRPVAIRFNCLTGGQVEIVPSEYYPRYGQIASASSIRYSCRITTPAVIDTLITCRDLHTHSSPLIRALEREQFRLAAAEAEVYA